MLNTYRLNAKTLTHRDQTVYLRRRETFNLAAVASLSKYVRAILQSFFSSADLKLLLHDAIFLATCVAMVLRDKLQEDCRV